MFSLKTALLIFLLMLFLLFSVQASAQEEVNLSREEPFTMEKMGEFKDTSFKQENFEKVVTGMTQEDVLSLLGRPVSVSKEQKKGHRWAFHYNYHEGYVVNFRNGLVVGKEKQ
jgi:outer membrane protein assembly factor BamE (lipoprotein component of BamABCDE complex)